MRTAPPLTRGVYAALLAFLMGVRLLTPAGFMPSFDLGAVTIVACPDADASIAAPAGHHHGHSKQLHQPCPYASASGLGWLAPDHAAVVVLPIFAAALLAVGKFLSIAPARKRDRPPLRGPPATA